MKPPRYEDIEADRQAIVGCAVRMVVLLAGLLFLALWLTSCAATTPATVKLTRYASGKEVLSLTYDPGNHIRVGNINLSPAALP